MTGLPELVPENCQLLGWVILQAMHFNGFKVDGIHIELVSHDKATPHEQTLLDEINRLRKESNRHCTDPEI